MLGTPGSQLANSMRWVWINNPLGQGLGAALSKSFPSAFANARACCLKATQKQDNLGAGPVLKHQARTIKYQRGLKGIAQHLPKGDKRFPGMNPTGPLCAAFA